jgi:hypothetical protein
LANKSNGSVYSSFEDAATELSKDSSAVDGTTTANQLAGSNNNMAADNSGQQQLTVNPRQVFLN